MSIPLLKRPASSSPPPYRNVRQRLTPPPSSAPIHDESPHNDDGSHSGSASSTPSSASTPTLSVISSELEEDSEEETVLSVSSSGRDQDDDKEDQKQESIISISSSEEDQDDDEESVEEQVQEEDTSLMARLSSFLPRLRQANDVLLDAQQNGHMTGAGFEISKVDDDGNEEEVDDEEEKDEESESNEDSEDDGEDEEEVNEKPIIEMELALGVLEEHPPTPPLSPVLRPYNDASSLSFPPDHTATESTILLPKSSHGATSSNRAKKPKIQVIE